MDRNLTLEDWKDLIEKYEVIERLEDGEKYSSINVDLGLDTKSDALRKAVSRLGYRKDPNDGTYYKETYEQQQDRIKLMTSLDIEDLIDQYAGDRYYKCLMDNYFDIEKETVSVEIDKDIYDEYIELAREIGCDEYSEEDLITLTLLEGLHERNPVNRRREHFIKYINECEYFSKEEVEFILQKDREGYDIERLVYAADDYDLLELTSEELEEYKIK